MKHLTTFIAAVISFAAAAQQMPYNPDANGDDFVGVDDVLGVLGVYDTALMQTDLQCDYEGTDFEQMIIGLIEGTLILDSVYVEYLLLDTATYFTPGCPDEVVEPIVLERSYMLTQPNNGVFNNGLTIAKVMDNIHFGIRTATLGLHFPFPTTGQLTKTAFSFRGDRCMPWHGLLIASIYESSPSGTKPNNHNHEILHYPPGPVSADNYTLPALCQWPWRLRWRLVL